MANNNIVLSWKLTDDPKNRYAYIYPKNGKYVRDKMNEKDIEVEFSSITGITSSSGAYHTNFMKMCDEVRSLGLTPPIRDDDYYGYINDDIIYGKDGKSGSVNVILISGQDGSNGSSGGSSGGSDGGGLGDGDGQAIIDQFNRELDEKLDEIRDEIEGQNESVIERITNDVKNTIENAKNEIYDAKDKIEGLQTELEEKLDSAQDALDEAKSLFDKLANGNIASGDINGVLEILDEYGDWINTYSGDIVTLKTDYDEAGKIGSIGVGENVVDGLFTHFATSLNVVSGTVGNVHRWMIASAGTIGDMATWYDISGSSVTEAASIINASAKQIVDVIKFVDEDIEGIIERKVDGIEGDIKDSIILETSSAITSINSTMNGLSGVVSDYITRLNYINGELTSMGSRMDASEKEIEEWMTITDSAMSIASDLRESWSVESGKLSTVANLIAKTDEDGNVIYYVSGASGNEITVYITNEFNEDGERIYKDFWGNVYSERQVYTYLSPVIMSYIQQTTSSITLSVVNSSAITAAIKLAITEDANGDQAIIGMVADKVVIDAELIAEAIKAKTANIGGIIIGSGIVKSMATLSGTSTPTFYLDGTSGYFRAENAQLNNAKVNGDIVAYSLKLGGTGIDDYIDSRIPSYDGITQEEVQKLFEDFIASDDFKNSIVVSGYVTEESFEQWKKNFLSGSTSGFTQEQLDYLDNLKDQIVGAEINNGITVKESGGTLVYTVKIGNNYYTWTKVDTENFIILGNSYGGKFIVEKDGLLTAHNAVIYGKIYSSEGNIGGLTLGNNMLKANDSEKKYIYFKKSDTEKFATNGIKFKYNSGVTYSELVADGINDSILELNDEIGSLTLTSGECHFSLTQSGITIGDYNAFCVEEEKEGTVQTYALISSSDSYKDDEMGKLVIGVGPTDSNCGIHHYYKYTLKTSSDITESIGNIDGGKYKTIYLKKRYSKENCSKKNEMVEAYLISSDKKTVEPITEYYFYYDYEIVTSGNETYYKDWIYVKNIATSVLDGLESPELLGYGNKDVVLGAFVEPAKHQIQIEFSPILDNGSGEIGGIGGGISGGASGGASGGGTGNNGSIDVGMGNGKDISFPYVGVGGFKEVDEEVILDIWNGNVKSDGILRGAMVVGTYGYADECVEVDTTDFNTKIYADGTIITNNLISEDGYFGGDINSKGVFSGELKDATGTLNNVSITADTINTSLVVSDGKSINAAYNSNTYFIVNNKNVEDGMDYENWTVDSFVWDKQNKNGTNAGKTYSEEKILLKVPIKTGGTINIPKMSGFVKRYAPRKKTNNRSSVYVNCYILSEKNYTYTVFNKIVNIPAFKGSGSKEVTFETPEVKNAKFSKNSNDTSSIGYLIIEFGMQIHLSTYSWLGLDKAAGHVYFNTDTSPIEITYTSGENGVHIGPNGLYAKGNIYLYSPNGQKGIEITDSGVTIKGLKQ